jgi:hypothetical protein
VNYWTGSGEAHCVVIYGIAVGPVINVQTWFQLLAQQELKPYKPGASSQSQPIIFLIYFSLDFK